MTDGTGANPYDEVPYPNLTFADAHPDRIATIGMLAGLKPSPVATCRVLELGCAGGANLASMALGLPGAEFVGVDYSAAQIAEGRDLTRAAGLANVRLEHRDILSIDPRFGTFDFIIAHGVYSWVPTPVREKILDVCRRNLAANGIAYVSYNTYPGWHALGGLREMMLWHTRSQSDPHERAESARSLVALLAGALPLEQQRPGSFLHAYAALLASANDNLAKIDSLLLHDELAPTNDPVYFHEFVEAAERHRLQYLAEVPFSLAMPDNVPGEAASSLRAMARNAVELDQYMDFVRNRTFRQSLICHAESEIRYQLDPTSPAVTRAWVSTDALPEDPAMDPAATGTAVFKTPHGARLSTAHPVSKAALLQLANRSPEALPFPELLEQALRFIYPSAYRGNPADFKADAEALAATLLSGFCYSRQLVELRTTPSAFTSDVSPHPLASPVARHLADKGASLVPSLRHERIELDPLARHLLPLLDGARSRDELVESLASLAAADRLAVEVAGTRVFDAAERRRVLGREVESTLAWLAKAALLLA